MLMKLCDNRCRGKECASDMITQNLQAVRERIAGAAKRAGRNPEDVLLVAVSKTKPVSMIEEAIAAEQFVFGEKRVVITTPSRSSGESMVVSS